MCHGQIFKKTDLVIMWHIVWRNLKWLSVDREEVIYLAEVREGGNLDQTICK